MNDYVEKFKERTREHIKRVNRYANKLNLSYPEHDKDKFGILLDGYSRMMLDNPPPEDIQYTDMSTLIHIMANEHHPEYWTNTDLEGFTRKNCCPNGIVDATQMPQHAITEMLCDWCAMSEEYGNSPFEWCEKVINKRWKFTPDQIHYIYETLQKLWEQDK